MSGERARQKKVYEDAVVEAVLAIKKLLEVVKTSEHLTPHEVQFGFKHLGHTINVVKDQAMSANALATTSLFSLDAAKEEPPPPPPAPVAPVHPRAPDVVDDPTLDLAPDVEVVGKMGNATLVHKEGRATLRLVGDLPPETGNAAPITEENLSLLQE